MRAVIRYENGLDEILRLWNCAVYPPAIRIKMLKKDEIVFDRDGELPYGTPLYRQRSASTLKAVGR